MQNMLAQFQKVEKKEARQPISKANIEMLLEVLKREEMELPANVRRELISHSKGMSWIEASKVANLTPHAMRQWRKHLDAENFINYAINSSLKESLGQLAQPTPALANSLIKLA